MRRRWDKTRDNLNSFELTANWQQCVIVREIDRTRQTWYLDASFRVIIALKLSRVREYRKINWLIVQPREAWHTVNELAESFVHRIAKQRVSNPSKCVRSRVIVTYRRESPIGSVGANAFLREANRRKLSIVLTRRWKLFSIEEEFNFKLD